MIKTTLLNSTSTFPSTQWELLGSSAKSVLESSGLSLGQNQTSLSSRERGPWSSRMILNLASQKAKSPSPCTLGYHPVGRRALPCTYSSVSIIQSDGQDIRRPHPYEKVSQRLAHVVLRGQAKTSPGRGRGAGSTGTEKELEPMSLLNLPVRVTAE